MNPLQLEHTLLSLVQQRQADLFHQITQAQRLAEVMISQPAVDPRKLGPWTDWISRMGKRDLTIVGLFLPFAKR